MAGIEIELGNAVVEGLFSGDGGNCCFGMYSFVIPKETEEIDDGVYKYVLIARMLGNGNEETENGKTAKLKNPISETVMVKTGIMGIRVPRMIVTKQGNIFVKRTMIEDKFYAAAIPEIIKLAWNWFQKYSKDNSKKRVGGN